MEAILEIQDLTVEFDTRRGPITAIEGINLSVKKGRALGLVGESGSGKSVTCLATLGVLPAGVSRVVSGSISFEGRNLLELSRGELRKLLGVDISVVMQDPFSSLNPVLTIGDQVSDSIYYHRLTPRSEIPDRVSELLKAVRIMEPDRVTRSYPFELSGGMRQRTAIASALAGPPKLLIADEATSALDVTVQAQLIKLLSDLRSSLGMSMIVVTHDFGVVANLCDDVAVMYCGQIVETGTTEEVLRNPKHPYTRALLNAIPSSERKGKKLQSIPGNPPDRRNTPPGCRFAPRCGSVMPVCESTQPAMVTAGAGSNVRCHLYQGAAS